jgi:hypothetical protein
MKRRPPRQPTAQQMIRAYLGQVSTAATRKLPKGDRLLFVGRTRAAIEAQVGPLASASDADAVAAALTALGDPEELATKERERLYSRGRQAAAPPTLWKPPGKAARRDTPPPAAKPARDRPAGPQPRKPRPWPYRRSGHDEPALPPPGVPGTAGAPGSAPPGPGGSGPGAPGGGAGEHPGAAAGRGSPPSGAAGPGAPSEAAGPGTPYGAVGPGARYGVVGPGMPPYGTGGPGAHNGSAPLGTGNGSGPGGLNGAAPAVPAGDTTSGPALSPAGPDESGPATLPGATPPGGTEPLSIVPGMDTPDEAEDEPAGRRFGPPVPLTEAWALARKNPLEAVAAVLLGVGGLIYPFPLWLIGGVVALPSRRWGKRDKWLALAGPPAFAVICMLLLGMTGGSNFFHALAGASHQFGLLLRVGCVLCAGYLVWRLRRGPRRRKLPPWQRGR